MAKRLDQILVPRGGEALQLRPVVDQERRRPAAIGGLDHIRRLIRQDCARRQSGRKRAEPKAAPAPPEAPPPEPEAATYTVHFSVSAGAGGAVVVDQVRHPLPAAVPLSPGLHAATFEQDGQQKSQMVYVGEASPRRYVFDASSGVVHTFK